MGDDGFRIRTAQRPDGLELARLRWDFTLEDHADEAIESLRAFTQVRRTLDFVLRIRPLVRRRRGTSRD